jgi:DNA-binding PadR family transcriptional regulator
MPLSVLDLYILSMFDRGCETPYDLHRDANLSLGAISPCVSRLLKAKLVTRVEEVNATRRPRHRYALTRAGKQQARTGWKEYLQSDTAPTDVDSVLRLADVAHYYKAGVHQIIKLLNSAGKKRLSRAEQLSIAVRGTEGTTYADLKNRIDGDRLSAEGSALIRIAEELDGRRTQGKKPAARRSLK